MSFLKFLKSSQLTGPGLVTRGIVLTLGFVIAYKWLVQPEFQRRKRREAESYADFIFEKERADGQRVE